MGGVGKVVLQPGDCRKVNQFAIHRLCAAAVVDASDYDSSTRSVMERRHRHIRESCGAINPLEPWLDEFLKLLEYIVVGPFGVHIRMIDIVYAKNPPHTPGQISVGMVVPAIVGLPDLDASYSEIQMLKNVFICRAGVTVETIIRIICSLIALLTPLVHFGHNHFPVRVSGILDRSDHLLTFAQMISIFMLAAAHDL